MKTEILDPHGCVEWCSPQAEPLLGLRWPEAAGKPLDELSEENIVHFSHAKKDLERS